MQFVNPMNNWRLQKDVWSLMQFDDICHNNYYNNVSKSLIEIFRVVWVICDFVGRNVSLFDVTMGHDLDPKTKTNRIPPRFQFISLLSLSSHRSERWKICMPTHFLHFTRTQAVCVCKLIITARWTWKNLF